MNRKFEGIWIPREVWLSEEMTLQEKVFLVEISSLDNANGCYANNEYFSKFFGISKTRVSNIINALVQKGLLTSYIKVEEGNKRYLKTLLNFSLRPSYRNVQDPLKESCKHNNTVNNTSNNTVSTYGAADDLEIPSEQQKKESPPVAAPPPTNRKLQPKVIFDKSLFADLNYTKQFFQGSEYQIANFDYYHAKVREWATRKEVKRDEQGWRDTFQNWIFKDSNRGELRTINNKIGHAINKPSTAGKQTAQSFADIEAKYS